MSDRGVHAAPHARGGKPVFAMGSKGKRTYAFSVNPFLRETSRRAIPADNLFRPNHLSGGPSGQTLVNGVSYGYANEMLQLNAVAFTETRTYNANLQLTELVSGTNVHLKYNYSATQNNGRIQSHTDVISGETVTYTYDSLNRLVSASATGDPSGAWTQSFTYDGFGNLTQKAGTNAPNNAFLATNPANNQLTGNGAQYDGNGNLSAYGTGSSAVSYSYDNENRLAVANASGATESVFGYDPSNQRVYQGTYGISSATYSNERIYFYGADGKKLVVYSLQSSGSNVTLTPTQTNTWFAGRLLVPQDRLRSVGKYFPYGEDRYSPTPANPANDQEKFATYTRDSATGLDYAYQRYYYSVTGRFLTADPYPQSANSSDPQSWNRASYVHNNPVSSNDPTGAFLAAPWMPGGLGWCPAEMVYYKGMCTFAIIDPVDSGPLGFTRDVGGGGGGVSATATCQNALAQDQKNTAAISRANSAASILKAVGAQYGIDWRVLAAIGVRETGFQVVNTQSGMDGIFQINIAANKVSQATADNTSQAAQIAAQILTAGIRTTAGGASEYRFNPLLPALAYYDGASSNQIKQATLTGNPLASLDSLTDGKDYVSNVLSLVDCFD